MKKIRLDSYRDVTISDEGYELLLAIVHAHKVCDTCREPYSTDFPQVHGNLCLACFQKKYASKELTYIGELSRDQEGDTTHMFIDKNGYIHTTATGSEQDPYKSTFQTLMYWCFPVPKFVEIDGRQVELSTWQWSIYGDVKKNSVLYIEYDTRSSDTKPIAFLTTKNGDTELFNRRRGRHRKLYLEAKAKLEATKDSHGEYHVNGHTVYGLYPAYIYEGIAELASAENDQKEQKNLL